MPSKETLRDKAEEEIKQFAIIGFYFFVVFSAIAFMKAAILDAYGITWTHWGIAALKAALCAKFVMLGRALRIGNGHEQKPLIWQTVYQSVVFLVFVSALNIVEESVMGKIHGDHVRDTLSHVGGGTVEQMLATTLILFLVFLPFFAFSALHDVMRDRGLYRTFFVERLDLEPVRPQPIPPGERR
jgi:hypothetical protein